MTFTTKAKGGVYKPKLRAAIGAVNQNAASIGYASTNAIKGIGYTYALSGGGYDIKTVNHSTLVMNEDGTDPTTIQPYEVGCYWRRTA